MNWRAWLDRIGRFFNMNPAWVAPVLAVQYGYGTTARWRWRNLLNLRITLGPRNTKSLYYNGLLYFRLMSLGPRGAPVGLLALPFLILFSAPWWTYLVPFSFVGVMVRWSADPRARRQFLQTHFGWKLNGEFAATFRLQNDRSTRESNKGPQYNNTGQAVGFADGTK